MASARARAPPTITGTASLSPQGCERTRHLLIPLRGQTPTTQAERAAQLARAAEEPSHRDTCVHVRLPCAVLDQPGRTRPTDEQTAAEDLRYLPQRPEWSILSVGSGSIYLYHQEERSSRDRCLTERMGISPGTLGRKPGKERSRAKSKVTRFSSA